MAGRGARKVVEAEKAERRELEAGHGLMEREKKGMWRKREQEGRAERVSREVEANHGHMERGRKGMWREGEQEGKKEASEKQE